MSHKLPCSVPANKEDHRWFCWGKTWIDRYSYYGWEQKKISTQGMERKALKGEVIIMCRLISYTTTDDTTGDTTPLLSTGSIKPNNPYPYSCGVPVLCVHLCVDVLACMHFCMCPIRHILIHDHKAKQGKKSIQIWSRPWQGYLYTYKQKL